MHAWHRKLDYASRLAATGLCFGTFGLASIVVSTVVFPLIRLSSPDEATTRQRVNSCIHHCYRFFIEMGRTLGMLSYEIHGGERLKTPGQLVVSNHPSLIDMLFIGSRMPQMSCIVKHSVQRNPFLGVPLRWAGYIPNGKPKHLIEDCVATLHAGNSLLVFPEGTRSVPGQPLTLKRGAAHIALASGCDLLPVTIVCSPSSMTKADVWYRVPLRRPHWRVVVGEPIRLAGLVVPDEQESLSARRVTTHLAEYFSAGIGLAAPAPTLSGIAPCDHATTVAASHAAAL